MAFNPFGEAVTPVQDFSPSRAGLGLGDIAATNASNQKDLAMIGLGAIGKREEAKLRAEAWEDAMKQKQGGNIFSGLLGTAASSLLSPIAGAFGGNIAKQLFPGQSKA